MSALSYPEPMPADGRRTLSGAEAARRDAAMQCLLAEHPTVCQGQVHVGIFFDGTGNNRYWPNAKFPDEKAPKGLHATNQETLGRHSNVVRLFEAYVQNKEKGFFRYYIPGLGTPNEDVGDTNATGYGVGGNVAAYMGADRINWGIVSIFNAMHRYLTGNDLLAPGAQRSLVNSISKSMWVIKAPGLLAPPLILPQDEARLRWRGLGKLEDQLAAVIKGHQRKITRVNVSIYGFSRGAAQARTCAHWLAQIVERHGGERKLAGVPLRVSFMGIFDTVSAVGLGDIVPHFDGHSAWAKGTQTVAPIVERCVHYVALHEQRASFPLEAAHTGNVGYPGMHSDVGGGYRPGEQGRSLAADGSEMISQVPLIDMHFAAVKAGEPMMLLDEPQMQGKAQKHFAISPTLVAHYNHWLSNHQVGPADVATSTQMHVNQLIRWRAQLALGLAGTLDQRRFFLDSIGPWEDHVKLYAAFEEFRVQLCAMIERRDNNQVQGPKLLSGFVKLLPPPLRMAASLSIKLSTYDIAPLTAEEKMFLAIALSAPKPADASVVLFDQYVHDSRAGFTPGGYREPILLTGGYLRYRHVFNQNPHENLGERWANAQHRDVSHATGRYLNDLRQDTASTYAAARKSSGQSPDAATAAYAKAQSQVLSDYRSAEQELMREMVKRFPRATA